MDVERKMICTMADNQVGGVSRALFIANVIHHPEERVMLDWALKPGEKFKLGAVYCISVVWLKDGEGQHSLPAGNP